MALSVLARRRVLAVDMTRALRAVVVTDSDETIPGSTFEAFFGDHADRLFGALCLLTRNRSEAEEVAQDAFLAVWERWDRVEHMDDPAGYLYRVAMNTARKRFRRAALAARVRVTPRGGDDSIDAADDRTTVGAALRALTPRQRLAIVLTDLLDLTADDAGSVMGVRPSTVRALAAQGRAAMRTTIGDTT
jgi:RNA polymerase sigma factor (sigma-70 family)